MPCIPAIFDSFKFGSATFGRRCPTGCIPALFDSFCFGDTTYGNRCPITPIIPPIIPLGGFGGGKPKKIEEPYEINKLYNYFLRNPIRKLSSEEIRLLLPILKEINYDMYLNESISKEIQEDIDLSSGISKELSKSIDVKTKMDYKKLIRMIIGM